MIGPVWYRFRSTFRRQFGGYLALLLLVGLMGGLAMGTIAAARRTQSSFPAFLAGTNPSDVSLLAGDLSLPEKLANLPHVTKVETVAVLNAVPLGRDGSPIAAANSGKVIPIGSLDGLLFDQDRVTVTKGRMADPARSDEFVATAVAARLLGLQVGEVVPVGIFTNEQAGDLGSGTPNVPPHLRVDVKLVGTVVFNDSVVEDDLHRFPTYVVFTPALTKTVADCCAGGISTGLQLRRGSRDVAVVEAEIEQLLGQENSGAFYVRASAPFEAQAERAIKPEAIALGVFGGIAALATLLIAGQAIARQLRLGSDDLSALRALGAGPAMTIGDGLIGVVGAIVIGSLVAAVVAAGLSPLAPIGPVRPVDPAAGIALDWTVLGLGVVLLIVVLSAIAAVLAYRGSPHRTAVRRRRSGERGSSVARAAAAAGLAVPVVTGVRLALEPGHGRNTVPVRSAILGAALAVIVVTGTVTFAASLDTLVSHPALYGWNWDYELTTPGSGGAIPPDAGQFLDHDRDVGGWTGVYFDSMQLDGQTVPVIAESPRASVGPPILSGHSFDAPDQVVLGATTLAELHKHLGDTVIANYGSTRQTRTRLTIVGTATMPSVGAALSVHPSIGIGALLSSALLPADSLTVGGVTGPNAIFVRLRSGASPAASLRSLQQFVISVGGDASNVLPVQRPAEIVNYRSMGNTPALLGVALAVGAVVALGLTLLASVHRRRRDLALLKTLGFSRRQLAAVVAWQSTVAVAIGTVVGVPLGIILGRTLWRLFARGLHVVPQPTVPGPTIALIAAGALVLANVVAALPGRRAARTPTAVLLRAE